MPGGRYQSQTDDKNVRMTAAKERGLQSKCLTARAVAEEQCWAKGGMGMRRPHSGHRECS
eukprot:1094889-Pelagomonas_calceolata.AAC.6